MNVYVDQLKSKAYIFNVQLNNYIGVQCGTACILHILANVVGQSANQKLQSILIKVFDLTSVNVCWWCASGVTRVGVDRVVTTVCKCPDVSTAPVISPGSAPASMGGRGDSATKVIYYSWVKMILTWHTVWPDSSVLSLQIFMCVPERSPVRTEPTVFWMTRGNISASVLKVFMDGTVNWKRDLAKRQSEFSLIHC